MGSILTACDERPVEKPRHVTPRKVAGGLQVGIPKAVAEVTDLGAINFAREHHFAKNEEISQKTGEIKRKCCVLCRELGFKPGRDVELHSKETNINSQGRWAGSRTKGKCLQCNVALCTEGMCFEIYHSRFR